MVEYRLSFAHSDRFPLRWRGGGGLFFAVSGPWRRLALPVSTSAADKVDQNGQPFLAKGTLGQHPAQILLPTASPQRAQHVGKRRPTLASVPRPPGEAQPGVPHLVEP